MGLESSRFLAASINIHARMYRFASKPVAFQLDVMDLSPSPGRRPILALEEAMIRGAFGYFHSHRFRDDLKMMLTGPSASHPNSDSWS